MDSLIDYIVSDAEKVRTAAAERISEAEIDEKSASSPSKSNKRETRRDSSLYYSYSVKECLLNDDDDPYDIDLSMLKNLPKSLILEAIEYAKNKRRIEEEREREKESFKRMKCIPPWAKTLGGDQLDTCATTGTQYEAPSYLTLAEELEEEEDEELYELEEYSVHEGDYSSKKVKKTKEKEGIVGKKNVTKSSADSASTKTGSIKDAGELGLTPSKLEALPPNEHKQIETALASGEDQKKPEVTEKPPVPEVTEKPPVPEVTEKPPAPEVTEKTPVPEVTEKPPVPEVTEKPPVPEVTEKPPVPEVTEKPPVPEVTEKPPVHEVTEKPPEHEVTGDKHKLKHPEKGKVEKGNKKGDVRGGTPLEGGERLFTVEEGNIPISRESITQYGLSDDLGEEEVCVDILGEREEGYECLEGEGEEEEELIKKEKISGKDAAYLKDHFGLILPKILAEIAWKRPPDPVHYLAHRLYCERSRQQVREQMICMRTSLNQERQNMLQPSGEMEPIKTFGFFERSIKSIQLDNVYDQLLEEDSLEDDNNEEKLKFNWQVDSL